MEVTMSNCRMGGKVTLTRLARAVSDLRKLGKPPIKRIEVSNNLAKIIRSNLKTECKHLTLFGMRIYIIEGLDVPYRIIKGGEIDGDMQ